MPETAGHIIWPSRMSLRLNESRSYTAKVDITGRPVPVPRTTDGIATSIQEAVVQCAIAARLVNVSDTLTVSSGTEAVSEGWIHRTFGGSGVVEWSWTVEARRPGVGELRLELEPVLLIKSGVVPVDTGRWSTVTRVDVSANALARTDAWIADNKAPVVGIWTTLIAVLTAVGAATERGRTRLKRLLGSIKPGTRRTGRKATAGSHRPPGSPKLVSTRRARFTPRR